jgi:DNA-binding NtrC family response regulator
LNKGFDVVAASNVTEALKLITKESFDVLITYLHMPNPSDGFAVITAMHHIQPNALTLLVRGYPDVKSAMDAILLEADEIIVKPLETKKLADLVRDKLLSRKSQGYTSAMLVHDSRILQVTLFGTLRRSLSALDFSLLLPDVMTIADEWTHS